MGRLIRRMQEVAEGKAANENRSVTARVISYDPERNVYTVMLGGAEVEAPNLGSTAVGGGETATVLMQGVRVVGVVG